MQKSISASNRNSREMLFRKSDGGAWTFSPPKEQEWRDNYSEITFNNEIQSFLSAFTVFNLLQNCSGFCARNQRHWTHLAQPPLVIVLLIGRKSQLINHHIPWLICSPVPQTVIPSRFPARKTSNLPEEITMAWKTSWITSCSLP